MDKHLNIFNFFNNNEQDYYEDNLSRAFALCLKYDTVFLDNILRYVLDDKHHVELFNTDYPDYSIQIDLQRRPSELEGYSRIIAVACSAAQVFVNQIDKVQARNTKDPETDVFIPRWPLENPPPVAGSKSPTLRQQNGCKLIQFLF